MQFYGILNQTEFEKELEQMVTQMIEDEKYNREEYYLNDESSMKPPVWEPHVSEIETYRQFACEELLIEKKLFKREFLNPKMNELEQDPDFNPRFEDFESERKIRSKLSDNVYDMIYLMNKDKNRPYKNKFFENFEEKIYGKGYKKARKFALREFKRIFNEMTFSDDFFPYEIGNSTYPLGKIEKLYKQKLIIIDRIKEMTYLPFLYGKPELYEYPSYRDQMIIDRIVTFQAKADILLQLNSEYGFEKDTLFNKILYYQLVGMDLGDKFTSESAFVFTMFTINSWRQIKPAELYGFYDFLKSEQLYVGTDKNFLRVIDTEFYLTFDKFKKPLDNKVELKQKEIPTIKEYESKHSKRVKSYKKEWDLFCEEYYPED